MPGTYQYDVEIKSNVAKLLSDMKQVQDRLDTVEGKEYKIKLNVDEKKLSSVISNLEKMLDSLGKGTGDFKQFENLSKELSSVVSEVQSLSKAFGKVDDSGTKTLLSSIQSIDKSLSKLSQNILNVNKNMSNIGGNTSGTVKQVENISNAYQNAAKEAEKLADAQSKIGQKTNISSGLDSNISKYQEIVSLVKEYYELTSKIKQPTLKHQSRPEDYDRIDGYLLKKAPPKVGTTDIEKDINDRYHKMAKGVNEGNDFAIKAMKSAIQRYWSDVTEMPSDNKLLSSRKVIPYGNKSQKEEYIIPKKYQDMEKSVIQETIAMNKNNIAYEEERKQIEANNSALKERMDLIRNTIKSYDKNPDYNGEYRMGLSLKSSDKGKTDIFSSTSSMSQEEMLQEICNMLGVEIPKNVDKAKEAIKEVASATATTEPKKDAFLKTSENLEQVVQSEQKVQQEAVATDKALDNISFTPNTEGFDDIIAKFGILREQAEQINKIVKTTKQTADGTPDISYKATLKNGSSYYLGENSTPQVLNASETVYDSNAIEKAYQEATKVNNALNETNSLLNSLKIPNGFEVNFSTLEAEIKRLNNEFGAGKISATEYANSIKKAFSNYQTPIDNRSKDIWNELTTSLGRYATLQKRIASNNALSTDNEEATKLLEHIHGLQRNDILPTDKLTASNEKLQQINQTVADLKAKLKESTLDSLQGSIDKYQKIYDQRSTYSSDFTPSEQYTKNLTDLDTAIRNLVEYRNTLKNVSEVTAEQEAELKRMVAACEKASDSFKSLSASEKGASQIAIDKLVQRINKDLDENTNYSKRAKFGLRALRDELESANPRNLKEITSEIINIENAEIRAGRAGKSFFDIFKTKGMYSFIGQMQSYLSMYIGFYGVMNKIKGTISTVKELDTALVDLKKTTTMNATQLNEFYYSANDVARKMGVTTEEIINQASAWSRLGYSSKESASEMAKLSSQFASISPGMDIDTATDGLVSTMKAFDISVDEVQRNIMDNINKIGNTAATSNSEIVDMLTRSSAAMAAANNTLEETIALETAAVEITRSSESTGTAFKTLSMRLRGYDEETESYTGDVEELSGAIADLTKTASTPGGISLFTDDTKQTYKSTYQLLKEISEIWDQLSDKDQAQLLEKLAGKRGGQVVAGLLSNFSAAEKAMKDMGEAAGSSDAEMGIIEQSIEYKLNNLKEIWVGTAQSIAKRDSLGGAIDALSKLSEGIGFVIKNFGLLKTAAIGLAGYLSFKNVGGSKMYDLILF